MHAFENGFRFDFHGEAVILVVPQVLDCSHFFDDSGEEGFHCGVGGFGGVGFGEFNKDR